MVDASQGKQQIPFAEWLKQKKRESRTSGKGKAEAPGKAEATQSECDERFLEWIRNKQREKSKQRKDGASEKTPTKHNQPFVKPPSLHINPVVKSSRLKINRSSAYAATSANAKRASPEQNDAVYAEWQRRKKREDRVKRNHAKLTRQLQEQAEKLQHLTRWKKKDVVCAYSTNHRSAQPHPVVKPAQTNMLVA